MKKKCPMEVDSNNSQLLIDLSKKMDNLDSKVNNSINETRIKIDIIGKQQKENQNKINAKIKSLDVSFLIRTRESSKTYIINLIKFSRC